jgi:putative transcriptional regulator
MEVMEMTGSALDRDGPGWLLVATPQLRDPNFRRTVVYLLACGADGAVGIVLNRPSETAVATVLPQWADHASRPPVMYVGGPVQTSAAMALGVAMPGVDPADPAVAHAGVTGIGESATPRTIQQVAGSCVLVNLDSEPAEAMTELAGVRIFAGHAGWSADQLAAEVADGAWYVLPGLPHDILGGPTRDLWFAVLRRQPWPLALHAYHPGDLTRN